MCFRLFSRTSRIRAFGRLDGVRIAAPLRPALAKPCKCLCTGLLPMERNFVRWPNKRPKNRRLGGPVSPRPKTAAMRPREQASTPGASVFFSFLGESELQSAEKALVHECLHPSFFICGDNFLNRRWKMALRCIHPKPTLVAPNRLAIVFWMLDFPQYFWKAAKKNNWGN